MKEEKLSLASRHAFARRFSANLKRLMDEKGLTLTSLGRVLYPESKRPESNIYYALRCRAMPGEDILAKFAKALGVPVEAFHTGELEQFKGGATVAAAHRRVQAKAKDQRPTGTSTDVHGPAERRGQPTPDVPDSDDACLYGFVFDSLRAITGQLSTTPLRLREFVLKLARLCREYQ